MNIFCSFVKNRIEMENLRRYPIGIQTFSEIRKSNYLYIDKTEYVYWMVHFTKYVFLSRPRRFGKSLLTSTLHSYFSGQKELFQGLAIEKLEKEWTEYPVLHFDMSTAKHADCEQLLQELNMKLIRYEEVYGKMEGEVNPNQRLEGLIKRAYEQTGPAFRLAEPASAEGFSLLSSTVAVSIGVAQTDNMALHDISVPRFVYFFVPITYQFS